ncbi:MAG TPA: hypothetical protein VJH03_05235 [Blastocatellia bacterium]|nr:hypothetical protein [Blastocatellia bacterium]
MTRIIIGGTTTFAFHPPHRRDVTKEVAGLRVVCGIFAWLARDMRQIVHFEGAC